MATEVATDTREYEPEAPEPADYATLNAVYGVLLTSVLVATRRRAKEHPIAGRELVPIAAATFALSKVIAREKIGIWVREPFVEHHHGQRRPRGRHLQRAIGELVTCSRCVGAWSALGLVGLRLAYPTEGRVVTQVLAASAANDWLQAGFRYATGKANEVNP